MAAAGSSSHEPDKEPPSKDEAPNTAWTGLGNSLEQVEVVRSALRTNDRLIQWDKPEMVGVVTMQTVETNCLCILAVLKHLKGAACKYGPPAVQELRTELTRLREKVLLRGCV